jgi:hypothetical protein
MQQEEQVEYMCGAYEEVESLLNWHALHESSSQPSNNRFLKLSDAFAHRGTDKRANGLSHWFADDVADDYAYRVPDLNANVKAINASNRISDRISHRYTNTVAYEFANAIAVAFSHTGVYDTEAVRGRPSGRASASGRANPSCSSSSCSSHAYADSSI